MEEKGLDQLLYEAYCEKSNQIQANRTYYLPWARLPIWIQHCWASVADVAVEYTRNSTITERRRNEREQ